MEFPKLYIKDLRNNTKYWFIYILNFNDKNEAHIITEIGILGSSKKKINKKIISNSSNYLKKAIKISNTLWNNKIIEGYTKNIKNIKKKTQIILPMKASNININKIIIPACIQYKLDGIRAMVHYNKNNNDIEFISKKGKNLHNLQHISKYLKNFYNHSENQNIWLDGELYTEKLTFNQIKGLIQRKEFSKDILKINLMIFDIYNIIQPNLTFIQRYDFIKNNKDINNKFKVKCNTLKSINDIDLIFNKAINKGYEGLIIRNYKGLYLPNRISYDIFKTKEFQIKEFTIINFKEGTGESKGTIIFELKCQKSNKSFWATVKTSKENSRTIFQNASKNPKNYIGKSIKVKFYKFDDITGCVTRNPIILLK